MPPVLTAFGEVWEERAVPWHKDNSRPTKRVDYSEHADLADMGGFSQESYSQTAKLTAGHYEMG